MINLVQKSFPVSGMNFNESKTSDILGTDIPPVPSEAVEEGNIEDKISGTETKIEIKTAVKEETKLLSRGCNSFR